MSTRLQVVMEVEELEEVRAAAARARLTTSEWVRLVLREARGSRGARASAAEPDRVREGAAAFGADGFRVPSRSPVLVDDRLVHLVMERYRFPSRTAAVDFALERAAEPLMSREEMLAMRGTGWAGDLDEIRSGNEPPAVRPDSGTPSESDR